MNQGQLNVINITLDSYCILICSIIAIAYFRTKGGIFHSHKGFIFAVFSNLIVSVSDIFTLVCEGLAHPWFAIALPVSMFIYYAANFTLLYAYVLFITKFLNLEFCNKKPGTLFFLLYLYLLLALVITPATGCLYEINTENHYRRGDCFWMAFVFEAIIFVCFTFLIIVNGKRCGRRRATQFFFFAVIPQVVQVVQTAFYGISLVNSGWAISTLIMFIAINGSLEEEIEEKNKEVESKNKRLIYMQNHTIVSLSNLVENRDSDTGDHVRRATDYVVLLAETCRKDGYYKDILTPHYIELLSKAAPMHDIGKIVVSDLILKKAGKLTPDEFEQMKRHTIEGGRIVLDVFDEAEDREYISITVEIATSHHEKWNGSGYPEGLKEYAIPLSARIMAVADVFDALVSPRVYKKSMDYEEAFSIIEEGSGNHFDPVLVKEFLKVRDKVIKINESYKVHKDTVKSL